MLKNGNIILNQEIMSANFFAVGVFDRYILMTREKRIRNTEAITIMPFRINHCNMWPCLR